MSINTRGYGLVVKGVCQAFEARCAIGMYYKSSEGEYRGTLEGVQSPVYSIPGVVCVSTKGCICAWMCNKWRRQTDSHAVHIMPYPVVLQILAKIVICHINTGAIIKHYVLRLLLWGCSLFVLGEVYRGGSCWEFLWQSQKLFTLDFHYIYMLLVSDHFLFVNISGQESKITSKWYYLSKPTNGGYTRSHH